MLCRGVFIWHETASFVWIHELMDFGRILFSLRGEGRTLQFVKFGHILSHCRHHPIRIWRKKRHLCPSIAGLYAPKFQLPENVFVIEIKYISNIFFDGFVMFDFVGLVEGETTPPSMFVSGNSAC